MLVRKSLKTFKFEKSELNMNEFNFSNFSNPTKTRHIHNLLNPTRPDPTRRVGSGSGRVAGL